VFSQYLAPKHLRNRPEQGALMVERVGGKFAAGSSGNPAGRPRRAIADLSKECRRHAHHALALLLRVIKDNDEKTRDRLFAAVELLNRGYGRAMQQISVVDLGRKLSELTPAEFEALEARLNTAVDDSEPAAGTQLELVELVH
jgi:hypothetical protein